MTTKKPLARFWKLDEIPEATTSRREWSLRLGDDWLVAAPYLRATGRLAKEIICPSPGADGCPRKVVKHTDGRFRAVCGNKPAECDPVELAREELTCLTLDRAKLAAAVGETLNAEPHSGIASDGTTTVVGSHGVAAGISIPIVLMIPGPMEVLSADTLTDLSVGAGPVAIAVPTPRSLPPGLKATFLAQGHAVLPLAEIITVKDHCLAGIRPADELLAALREKLLAAQAPATSGRAWLLPAHARWEDLTFDFTADEVVNVRFGKETRRFEPEQFGLKNKKNGRPTSGWILLRSMARQGGSLTWKDRTASAKIKKQKQILSSSLQKLFGINGDPIPSAPKGYQARFTIRDRTPDSAPARKGRG